MNENELNIQISKMCSGCAFLDQNGVCNRPWIKAEGQKFNAEYGICADAGLYDANDRLSLGMRSRLDDGTWITDITWSE